MFLWLRLLIKEVLNLKMASSAPRVPKVKLNSGYEIPMLGLGTVAGSAPTGATQAVKDAIDVGYRHFDCACIYYNEDEVGKALTEKMASGDVKREELFITSKLWNTFHKPESVEPALKKSLSLLGLDYLDLYLIHCPITIKEKGDELLPMGKDGRYEYEAIDHADTWAAMEKCVEKGLVRSIGLSNFNSKQIQHVLDNCKIKPVVNQVESHPFLNQKRLIEFCKERDIHITAYSPLGAPNRAWAKPGEPKLMENPTIIEMAEKYKKTPAQVLIRYQIERGVSVIPKSFHRSRMETNFDIFDFKIEDEDMQRMDSLDRNKRYCDLFWWKESLDYPFNIEF